MKDDKIPLEDPPPYEDVVDTQLSTNAQANPNSSSTAHKRNPNFWRSKTLFLLGVTGSVGALLNPTWYQDQNVISARPNLPEPWDSRKRYIDTGSQRLSAEYDLLDVLTIRSSSGSVDVGVNPKPADEEHPRPAKLSISTHSGSINVDFVTFDPPDREYQTSISTHSGSIGGTILHGQKTSVTSSSSSQQITFVVHKSGNYSSSLQTRSSSGSQEITIETSSMKGESITEMSSVHSLQSGSLELVYPGEWAGTIEGHTQSGHINLHGDDIDIVRRGSSGHHIVAKKGKGNSTLKFNTASGGVDIYFS